MTRDLLDAGRFEQLVQQLPSAGPGRLVALGIDGSWSSCGWAIATAAGPLAAGVRSFGGQYRERDLSRLLDELGDRADEVPVEPGRRYVLVERAPQVYRGRGNQAATAYGLGVFVGQVQQWAFTRPGWHYPWTPGTEDWRRWWWDPSGRRVGRESAKAAAVQLVQTAWPHVLAGLATHTPKGAWEGPAVDVAEAVLIAVGGARVARLGGVSADRKDRSLPPRLPRDWPTE